MTTYVNGIGEWASLSLSLISQVIDVEKIGLLINDSRNITLKGVLVVAWPSINLDCIVIFISLVVGRNEHIIESVSA